MNVRIEKKWAIYRTSAHLIATFCHSTSIAKMVSFGSIIPCSFEIFLNFFKFLLLKVLRSFRSCYRWSRFASLVPREKCACCWSMALPQKWSFPLSVSPVNMTKSAGNWWFSLHKKWSFPLRISLVNVNKSAVSCGIIHIY